MTREMALDLTAFSSQHFVLGFWDLCSCNTSEFQIVGLSVDEEAYPLSVYSENHLYRIHVVKLNMETIV
jgi:hypothetical protein